MELRPARGVSKESESNSQNLSVSHIFGWSIKNPLYCVGQWTFISCNYILEWQNFYQFSRHSVLCGILWGPTFCMMKEVLRRHLFNSFTLLLVHSQLDIQGWVIWPIKWLKVIVCSFNSRSKKPDRSLRKVLHAHWLDAMQAEAISDRGYTEALGHALPLDCLKVFSFRIWLPFCFLHFAWALVFRIEVWLLWIGEGGTETCRSAPASSEKCKAVQSNKWSKFKARRVGFNVAAIWHGASISKKHYSPDPSRECWASWGLERFHL